MTIIVYEGKNRLSLEFFECGLITKNHTPYTIKFSSDDKYLVVESDSEGGGGFAIDVFEAKLGNPALQWHLSTFETSLPRVSGTGLLPLVSAGGGTTVTGSLPTTNPLLALGRTLCRF